ncbi:MAG: phosphoribosylanthranilate isomerase [Methanomassiliicoccales archaeon]
MPSVKICGNRTERDVRSAAGADYIGFVVEVHGARRSISTLEAKPLIRMASDLAATVVVTTNSDERNLKDMVAFLEPDFLQLHFEPETELIASLKKEGIKTIVLVSPSQDAVEKAVRIAPFASMLFSDTLRGGMGGTGVTHDWQISRRIRDVTSPVPFMLSGGLNAGNLALAVRTVRPDVLDVSSGVEESGMKSRRLVEEFIGLAREMIV